MNQVSLCLRERCRGGRFHPGPLLWHWIHRSSTVLREALGGCFWLTDLTGKRSCLLLVGFFNAQLKPHLFHEAISSSTVSLYWTFQIILAYVTLLAAERATIINCLFKSMSPGEWLFLSGKSHVSLWGVQPVPVMRSQKCSLSRVTFWAALTQPWCPCISA